MAVRCSPSNPRGARLIGARQPAIGGDIGRQDGCKSAFGVAMALTLPAPFYTTWKRLDGSLSPGAALAGCLTRTAWGHLYASIRGRGMSILDPYATFGLKQVLAVIAL
jgi:hypothetical protein